MAKKENVLVIKDTIGGNVYEYASFSEHENGRLLFKEGERYSREMGKLGLTNAEVKELMLLCRRILKV